MRFLLGSNFWKMNVENSDKDYRDYVFPSRDDLFNAKVISVQRKMNIDGVECDVELKDIRLILKELRKGSLKIFEVFYSKPLDELSIRERPIWEFIENNKDELFQEVKYEFMKSVLGEGVNRLTKLKNEFEGKQLAHAQKLLWLLTLSHNCDNPFDIILGKTFTDKLLETRLNPTKKLMRDIENGFISYKNIDFKRHYREDKPKVDELEKLIKDMVFIQ